MFYRRQGYFYRLMRSFPVLKYFDLQDPQSFIRQNVLDNIIVCIFVYGLFYFAVWYADKIIKKIEKVNAEMFGVMEENKTKLDDLITLRKKRIEYEDVVIKTKGVQRQTEKYLVNELEKLGEELATTVKKIGELDKVFGKCKSIGSTFNAGIPTSGPEGECIEGVPKYSAEKTEDVKILEPSFPPPMPPEPPPRKYGIFVARPPGHRVNPGSLPPSPPPAPKIGFKLSSVC